ncbi:hypothetical protein GR205_27495 [Rhizobium leguminosarum]|uniref:hypothetical protein n=1 Tax=Rhizobium ruizarguesonis TaxID=2081791 RepID=UPI0013DFF6E8|nr:hypothetical protein [Rhizobium ruizarguesonis]NEJ31723.1 hypothetical protein [Rhizobium ruizarguesonis]
MSAKILLPSSSSSSPPEFRGPAKTGTALAGRRRRVCQDDPALVVGLALAFTRQGAGAAAAIPLMLLDRLSYHAWSGDPACRLVLDWLTEKANKRHDLADSSDGHASAQHADPAEIVSASAAFPVEDN